MNAWLGVDVSKATLDVCLWCDPDQQETQVPNSRDGFRTLQHFLQQRCKGKVHGCLEATGLYGDAVAE